MSRHIRDWWRDIPKPLQLALKKEPRRSLTADEVAAVTGAGGAVVGGYFLTGGSRPDFELSEEQAEWVDQLGAIDD